MVNNALVIAAKAMGAKVLPETATWTNRVEVRSQSSNALYVVAQRKTDGVIGCSCRGWIRHRHCKHSSAFKSAMIAAERAAKGVK